MKLEYLFSQKSHLIWKNIGGRVLIFSTFLLSFSYSLFGKMTSRKRSVDSRTKSTSVNDDDDSDFLEDELIEQLRQKALSVNVEKYEINARVLCQHSDHMFYDAKIIKIDTTESGTIVYTIHYTVSFISKLMDI